MYISYKTRSEKEKLLITVRIGKTVTDLSSVAEEGKGVARVEGSQLVTPTSMEPDQLVTLDSILTSNM